MLAIVRQHRRHMNDRMDTHHGSCQIPEVLRCHGNDATGSAAVHCADDGGDLRVTKRFALLDHGQES